MHCSFGGGQEGASELGKKRKCFRMSTPELCLLRFVVYDVDMFGEPNFIGHYTIPVKCALGGVRSVPLRNAFSEELELAGQPSFHCT